MANYAIFEYDGQNWIRLASQDDVNDPSFNKSLVPWSPRDFEHGTLVKTSIDYTPDCGDAFYLEIKGDMYGYGSIFTVVSGYIYNDHEGNPGPIIANRIVNHSSTCCITAMTAMCIDGKLCFWWPRLGYWQSFSVVCCRSSAGNYYTNCVTEISNSTDPSSSATKVFDMTSNGNAVVYPVTTDNVSQQSVYYASNAGNADTLDSLHASSFVRHDVTQSLSSTNKSRARSNIGAGRVESLSISGNTLYYHFAGGGSGSVELPAASGGSSQIHSDIY